MNQESSIFIKRNEMRTSIRNRQIQQIFQKKRRHLIVDICKKEDQQPEYIIKLINQLILSINFNQAHQLFKYLIQKDPTMTLLYVLSALDVNNPPIILNYIKIDKQLQIGLNIYEKMWSQSQINVLNQFYSLCTQFLNQNMEIFNDIIGLISKLKQIQQILSVDFIEFTIIFGNLFLICENIAQLQKQYKTDIMGNNYIQFNRQRRQCVSVIMNILSLQDKIVLPFVDIIYQGLGKRYSWRFFNKILNNLTKLLQYNSEYVMSNFVEWIHILYVASNKIPIRSQNRTAQMIEKDVYLMYLQNAKNIIELLSKILQILNVKYNSNNTDNFQSELTWRLAFIIKSFSYQKQVIEMTLRKQSIKKFILNNMYVTHESQTKFKTGIQILNIFTSYKIQNNQYLSQILDQQPRILHKIISLFKKYSLSNNNTQKYQQFSILQLKYISFLIMGAANISSQRSICEYFLVNGCLIYVSQIYHLCSQQSRFSEIKFQCLFFFCRLMQIYQDVMESYNKQLTFDVIFGNQYVQNCFIQLLKYKNQPFLIKKGLLFLLFLAELCLENQTLDKFLNNKQIGSVLKQLQQQNQFQPLLLSKVINTLKQRYLQNNQIQNL